MFSLDQFHEAYATVTTPVTIGGRSLALFTPATIDRFIDPEDPMHDFPLWSKIWEASGVLANYLVGLPADESRTMLEIGCGIGMVGIAAALAGHRVTMTERDPHAINFARANAAANGCTDIVIDTLDWNAPHLPGTFDYIVGSEVIYRDEDIDGLENLFSRYLKPEGMVILAEGVRRTGVTFWQRMESRFQVKARRQRLEGDGETRHIVLFCLQPRPVSMEG